jgi:hypothetical protein
VLPRPSIFNKEVLDFKLPQDNFNPASKSLSTVIIYFFFVNIFLFKGGFDASARFNGNANVPPPPPGCAPNAAQVRYLLLLNH